MQENWDTIDPKLLHLDRIAVCDQNIAQDARANSTLQASDFPHVDEEAVDALAYDRRDSDTLAIVGHFEFETPQGPHGLGSEEHALPSPLYYPGDFDYSQHTGEDGSIHQGIEEPWSHLRVTCDVASWNPTPTTRRRQKSETVIVSPLFTAVGLTLEQELGNTQWPQHPHGASSCSTQLKVTDVSHNGWVAPRPQLTYEGWLPAQHPPDNYICSNVSPQTFSGPITPPQNTFDIPVPHLPVSSPPKSGGYDYQTLFGNALPSPQYSNFSTHFRDEHYRAAPIANRNASGKQEYPLHLHYQQGNAQASPYTRRDPFSEIDESINHGLGTLGSAVPEYRPSEEQWTGVDEGINGTVTNCIRNETDIQHQSQPITIPSNRRSRASSLHKPGSRGRPSSADEVHQYLNFIREDGRGSVLNRGGIIQRGTRHGPLTKEQARETARTRKEQKVCMKCREDRSKCSGGIPCEKCYKLQLRGTLKTPCMKAQFLEIVEAGSCNYISQRAINHLTLNGQRRVQMFLPETFKLGELLSLLETRQNNYRIKARSQFGPLYTLDLRKCYQFLANTCADETTQEFDLRDFIDNKLLRTSEWFECVSDFRRDNGIVALLAQWNNMPSRATYSFEPLNGSPSRDMNVEEPQDQVEIVIAAQLSRIICRKAELDGYKALQSAINQTRQKSPLEIQKFAYELGQLLVTLRWRMSWWELLGDGSNKDDIFRDRFIERVRRLSMTLYFYYCSMMRRLPGFSDARAELRGTASTYADAAPFFDDFPEEESIEGFERWMERGKELVRHAGVAQRLSRYQSLQR